MPSVLFRALLVAIWLPVTDAGAASALYGLRHALPNPGTDAQPDTQQGWSVAIAGNLVAVGAPHDDLGATDSGVVKVYDASTGARLHTLTNPSPAANDWFGAAVALSGTRLAVGAPMDNTLASDAGVIYVYDLASATPRSPVAVLTNPSKVAYDNLGWAIAMSDTRVVAGAIGYDTAVHSSGIAYVYDLASATPASPILTLTNPSPAAFDVFGLGVAISGTKVAVGASLDDLGASDTGIVYVYDLASATPALPAFTFTNPSQGAADYFGRALALSGTHLVVGAPYADSSVTNSGRAYVYDLLGPTPKTPVFTLEHPDSVLESYFGAAVAIFGDRIVVGAYYDGPGSVFVYDLTRATPQVPTLTLKNPSVTAGQWFGFALDISGTRVVVGEPYDNFGAFATGSAYVYELASLNPTVPVVTLADSSPVLGDEFGFSVALSGPRLAVGAFRSDTGASDAGSVFIYNLASLTPGVPIALLTNPTPALADQFGQTLSLSGSRVVVGTPSDDTGTSDSGSAYVYDLDSATPTLPWLTLTNPAPQPQGYFGDALAISGQRLLVGASHDNTGKNGAGVAYVYDLARATPAQPAMTLTNPHPTLFGYFGSAVALSGARAAVGASRNDTMMPNAGTVYVYDFASLTPTVPLLTLTNPTPAPDFNFGAAVALSGSRVAVGAYWDNTGASHAGSVYIYNLAGPAPTVPELTLTNPNPAPNDVFGHALSLSGSRLVVGAYKDDAAATDAGAVYVYELAGATPAIPVATLPKPSPAADDWFGYAVAIEGTTIVAGAPFDDTNAADRGAAYVFGLSQPTLQLLRALEPGVAELSWTPFDTTGFVLQHTPNLSSPNWVSVITDGLNPIQIPTTNSSGFYRLVRP